MSEEGWIVIAKSFYMSHYLYTQLSIIRWVNNVCQKWVLKCECDATKIFSKYFLESLVKSGNFCALCCNMGIVNRKLQTSLGYALIREFFGWSCWIIKQYHY